MIPGLSALQRFAIGALAASLVMVLAWAFRLDHLRGSHLSELDAARRQLETSGASIATLQATLDEQNAQAMRRAIAFANAREQDAAAVAAADERAKAAEDRLATLRAFAANPSGNPECRAPDALLRALEGL